MSKEFQRQECRVRALPLEAELHEVTCLRSVQSQHHRWSLDEKAVQLVHWKTVGQASFFFFEMIWKGKRLQMTAREEVGRKESGETVVA